MMCTLISMLMSAYILSQTVATCVLVLSSKSVESYLVEVTLDINGQLHC